MLKLYVRVLSDKELSAIPNLSMSGPRPRGPNDEEGPLREVGEEGPVPVGGVVVVASAASCREYRSCIDSRISEYNERRSTWISETYMTTRIRVAIIDVAFARALASEALAVGESGVIKSLGEVLERIADQSTFIKSLIASSRAFKEGLDIIVVRALKIFTIDSAALPSREVAVDSLDTEISSIDGDCSERHGCLCS